MYRKLVLLSVVVVSLLIFAACSTAAPQAPQAATEEQAQEEAPAEEIPTEEMPSEEMPAEEETAADDEAAAGEAATYTIDTEASTIEWYGERPLGNSEAGTVAIQDGQLSFTGDQLVDGSFTIDMTSITPTSKSGDMLDRLTGHLMSDDFFGVETYPTSMLVLKSAEPTGEPNQYKVVGDLTVKEITDEIEFLTDVTVGEGTIEAEADIIVDRSIYDVRYGSGSFFSDLGDDLISDEMQISVSLVANAAE